MQLGGRVHFHEIIIPAWQEYLTAEADLTAACNSADQRTIEKAGFRALRFGGSAVFYLSHFADIVAHEQSDLRPTGVDGLSKVRLWVASSCEMLRNGQLVEDVSLLADVCDALKHSQLTHRLETRRVVAREAVLVLQTGFGELNFGEGKFGGADQVVVLATSGTRALSSVLQNVVDAWRRSFGWELSPIGEP